MILLLNNPSFVIQQQNFIAKFLLFTEPYAWCIDTGKKEWASVNLGEKYLIYRFAVDGYKAPDNTSYNNLAKSFQIDYSLDGSLWASYEGGRVSANLNITARHSLWMIVLSFNAKLLSQCLK